MVVPQDFAHRIPEGVGETQAAPLLCAGAIGYRSLRLTNLEDGQNLGLTDRQISPRFPSVQAAPSASVFWQ
jgi:hypothetical protein